MFLLPSTDETVAPRNNEASGVRRGLPFGKDVLHGVKKIPNM
jgi:hypothetical protein